MNKSFEKKYKILTLFISCIVCYILVEIILRTINIHSVCVITRDDSDFIEYDKELSYTYKPNLNVKIEDENYSITVTTNSFGYRDREWTFSDSTKNILALGNSFTVGHGLEAEKRWTSYLETILSENCICKKKIQIYNAAVSGYNIIQMISTGKRLLPIIKPEIVILGIYIEGFNRISDPFTFFHGFSLRSSKQEFAKINDEKLYILHSRNPVAQNIELLLLKYSKLYNLVMSTIIQMKNRPSSNNENFANLNEFIIASEQIVNFHDYLKSQHIKLLILPIIQHNRNNLFEDATINKKNQLVILCNKHHIPVVDLLNILNTGENLWINNDAHWNEHAQYTAAKSLANIISKNKLLK